MDIFNTICNTIILVGAALAAFVGIVNTIKKPILWNKKKKEEKEVLNKKLDNIQVEVAEVKRMNEEQNEKLEKMEKSSLDLLRKNILDIYHKGKATKTISQHDKEYLEDLYRDYRSEGGNSYIEKVYNRMAKWEIVDDEE